LRLHEVHRSAASTRSVGWATRSILAMLAQLDRYLAGLGLGRGWLVIFDRRASAGRIAGRTRVETRQSPEGRAIATIRA
jgi:hypothetical protein